LSGAGAVGGAPLPFRQVGSGRAFEARSLSVRVRQRLPRVARRQALEGPQMGRTWAAQGKAQE